MEKILCYLMAFSNIVFDTHYVCCCEHEAALMLDIIEEGEDNVDLHYRWLELRDTVRYEDNIHFVPPVPIDVITFWRGENRAAKTYFIYQIQTGVNVCYAEEMIILLDKRYRIWDDLDDIARSGFIGRKKALTRLLPKILDGVPPALPIEFYYSMDQK